jgi:nitrite reductase/ring-hydroxylating ferredoxin subunit
MVTTDDSKARSTSRPRVSEEPSLPDAWWPIAFSDEVHQHPRAFRLGWQDFAVYRDLGGVVRAVDDACPHRRLPLSMGRLTEDGYLQCAYHGWCYDGSTGQCTAIPNLSQDERVPRGVKVRAFATVENVADALGWGLRLPALAPRVGPPTGEEPEEGTTMSPASVVGPFVFVWSGDEPAPVAPPPQAVAPPTVRGSTVAGELTVRAPHDEVCDALVWNPGKLIGQGWLLGGGDEVRGPSVEAHGSSVTVRRRRLALDPPRVSTFGPAAKRVVDSVTTTDSVTGLTSIAAAASGPVPPARVVVALTPIGRYRTQVRWSTTIDGSGWRHRAAAAAIQSARLHPPSRAESVVDAGEGAIDSAVDLVRDTRRVHRSIDDQASPE